VDNMYCWQGPSHLLKTAILILPLLGASCQTCLKDAAASTSATSARGIVLLQRGAPQSSFASASESSEAGSPEEYAELLLELGALREKSLPEPDNSWLEIADINTSAPASSVDSALGGIPGFNKPTNTSDAAAVSGVKKNAVGDLTIFATALATNSVMVLLGVLFISILRRSFPMVYQCHRQPDVDETRLMSAMKGFQTQPVDGFRSSKSRFFGWITDGFRKSSEEIESAAGLDRAMLVEFTELAQTIMIRVGLPLMCLLAPLHCFQGGDAAGDDRLTWLGFGNVEHGSWLCWVHAIAVWYVVVLTSTLIFSAMRKFMPRRAKWLKEMPAPRSTTVLVEGIPDEKRTAQAMRKVFDESVFGYQAVNKVEFVKDTSELISWQRSLEKATATLNGHGWFKSTMSAEMDQRQAQAQVERLQNLINKTEHRNSGSAFVTFERRREAAIACKIFSPEDEEHIEVSVPPDPGDVIYADLLTDPTANSIRELTGYFLIAILFAVFMPLVVGIQAIASVETLRNEIPFFETLIQNFPAVATLWNGIVASAALTTAMSLLPTCLSLIFVCLFSLKAQAWLQHLIQQWFYLFLVIFVLLVTAIGSSIIATFSHLVQQPMDIFPMLATSMPQSTHFYLNYIPLQWVAMVSTTARTANLGKYLVFRMFHEPSKAKELSEPEDQDYEGIGSRCARNAIVLTVALTFCTLTPTISLWTLIYFVFARVCYTYLFMEAEGRKPDLGGVFWVTQLRNILHSLALFIILMAGVLAQRANSFVPSLIAGSSLVYWYWSLGHFRREFKWEDIPIDDLQHEDAGGFFRVATKGSYRQPELPEHDTDLQQAISVMRTKLNLF